MIVLPFPPEVFVGTSVQGAPGSDWEQRFWALWNATPEARREGMNLPVSDDAYGTCNARLLEWARNCGNVHLIALWDGKGGDGPGGTADLVRSGHQYAGYLFAGEPRGGRLILLPMGNVFADIHDEM